MNLNVLRHGLLSFSMWLGCTVSSAFAFQAMSTEIGVAKIDITPTDPVILAGYGSRQVEHEGVDEPIWARALVIGSNPASIVIAVDNCGIPKQVTQAVADALHDEFDLAQERLVLCSTHTHSAPTLSGYAPVVWSGRATAAQLQQVDRYTLWLTEQIIQVARDAMQNRQPASLSWGQGRVRFGGNRRVMRDGVWQGFGLQPDAPVDHSLPVMVARRADQTPIAIWTNYACHCTTAGDRNRISGDWAGYANQAIEREFPLAISVLTIGCGADVGPQPSGNLELAKQHGESLAAEVQRLLAAPLKPLNPNFSAVLERIELPLSPAPPREHFERLATQTGFEADHARLMLATLEANGELPKSVEYPISCWRFDDQLAILFLGGEVVVDYSVRLKRELDWQRLWINGWSNDVPSYIPSRRVLFEGGYEADFSQLYYGHPSRYAPEIEDRLIEVAKRLIGDSYLATDQTPSPDFLSLPTSADKFAERVVAWYQTASPEVRQQAAGFAAIAAQAQNGFAKLETEHAAVSAWFDYSGAQSSRPYIRQQALGAALSWSTPKLQLDASQSTQRLIFLGGIGWITEPQTEGFELLLNDQTVLTFDVTTQPTEWRSADGNVILSFLPTWTSDNDAAGLFQLQIDNQRLIDGASCRLTVRSLGSGSQRWFAVDEEVDAIRVLKTLQHAVRDEK